MIKTCEFVSPKHPDKICDFIADSILDAFLKDDPFARVGLEVAGGHRHITIVAELTSRAKVNIKQIVKNIVGQEYSVDVYTSKQSSDIARGVDIGGACDQGIMVGYATNETANFMPYEYELARDLCRKIYEKYPVDGKVQVTVDGQRVLAVVASFHKTKSAELEELVRAFIKAEKYFINPAGEWHIGGFDADSGVSGRKIVVDSYGPNIPVGGGAFSGKDYTKVDKSGAYMARKIAVDLLKKNKAREVTVKLAYAIGIAKPLMATAEIVGDNSKQFADLLDTSGYDLSPAGIRKLLGLDKLRFSELSAWGHFGRNHKWDE